MQLLFWRQVFLLPALAFGTICQLRSELWTLLLTLSNTNIYAWFYELGLTRELTNPE